MAHSNVTNPSQILDIILFLIQRRRGMSYRLRPQADGACQGPPGCVIRTDGVHKFDASDTMIKAQHLGLHTKESTWDPTAQ